MDLSLVAVPRDDSGSDKAVVPYQKPVNSIPKARQPTVTDLDGDSSDSSADSSTTTATNPKRGRGKQTLGLRHQATLAEQQKNYAKNQAQAQRDQQEARQNNRAEYFAKKQTILINLGDPEKLAANISKANQHAKESVNKHKASRGTPRTPRTPFAPHAGRAKRSVSSNHPGKGKKAGDRQRAETSKRAREERSGSTATSGNRTSNDQPQKKKRKDRNQSTPNTDNDNTDDDSENTLRDTYDLADMLQDAASNGVNEPGILTPPGTPAPEHMSRLKKQRKANEASTHPTRIVVAVREYVDIDFDHGHPIDLSNDEALNEAKTIFRFPADPKDIHETFRHALKHDLKSLGREHKERMDILFSRGSVGTNTRGIMPIKCLRSYLFTNDLPKANKIGDGVYACRRCTQEGVLCYALIPAKTKGGINQLIAVVLPLEDARRPGLATPDREEFYQSEGDLFMSGAL